MDLRWLKLPVERIASKTLHGGFDETEYCFVGKDAVVLKPKYFAKSFPEYAKMYPNKRLTAKIYDLTQPDSLDETCTIKNIGWLNGFAPRTYRLVAFKLRGDVYPVQLMDYVEGDFTTPKETETLWKTHSTKLAKYGVKFRYPEYYSANYIDGKLVDFGTFYFDNKDKYKNDLYDRFSHTAVWGNNKGDTSYQDMPWIGVPGGRTMDRYRILGLEESDLEGKTVLDIGCSGGQVLYFSSMADRIVGVDLPKIADVAFEMANFHGQFHIETVGCDLTGENVIETIYKQTGLKQFDVVFMFSVNHHIGFHKYMRKLCKDTLYLETNAARWDEKEWYPEQLRKIGFTEFEHKGAVQESGGRELFICH